MTQTILGSPCKRGHVDANGLTLRYIGKNGKVGKCIECTNARYANFTLEQLEAYLEYQRERYANFTPEEREAHIEHYRERYANLTPEEHVKHNMSCNEAMKKYNKTPNGKLRLYLRTRINSAIKNNQKAGSAVRDLGCSIEQLKQHLESQFQLGMTWENWGRTANSWSIDHIKPLSKFDLSDRQQLLEACHFSNLRPLWHLDNIKKGNRT